MEGMNNNIIGLELRKLRKAKKLKIKEVASIVGISAGAMGNIEAGSRIPSFELLDRLSIALNFTLLDFTEILMQRIEEIENTKENFESKQFYMNKVDEYIKGIKKLMDKNKVMYEENILDAISIREKSYKILLTDREKKEISNLVCNLIDMRIKQISDYRKEE